MDPHALHGSTGESNGGWGSLAEGNPPAADDWDTYAPLPEPGENATLDAFLANKRITYRGLLRQSARLSKSGVLAFPHGDGVKYRRIVPRPGSRNRWSTRGVTWRSLKIVRAGGEPASTVIVVEGETDAARLIELYGGCDVAVMPAGALTWKPEFVAQLQPYSQVLAGLDNDENGRDGAAKITESIVHAVRFAPPEPAKDWCEVADEDAPPLPAPLSDEDRARVTAAAVLQCYGEIESARAEWVWSGRIPRPMLTLVVGTEGLGKTAVLTRCAADLTRGTLPGCFEGEPVNVALLTPEDSAAHTMRPRLEAAGADVDRTFRIKTRESAHDAGLRLPQDAGRLMDAFIAGRIKAVMIDPLHAILDPEVNTWSDSAARLAFGPFAEAAADNDITLVGVLHTNKSNSNDPRQRGIGTVGWRQMARSALLVGLDPDDAAGAAGTARCIAQHKCNVGPLMPTLSFELSPRAVVIQGQAESVITAELGAECGVTAQQMLAAEQGPGPMTDRDRAAAWVDEYLADGPKPAAEMDAAAERAGFSKRTLERARSALDVTTFQKAGKHWRKLEQAAI